MHTFLYKFYSLQLRPQDFQKHTYLYKFYFLLLLQ